jgi:hypothetical protein
MTASSPVYWGWVSPTSAVSDSMLNLLTRVRRGDDIMAISCDYPELSAAQISMAKALQVQEAELNRLYKELQTAEGLKLQLERDLTGTLLRTQGS